MSYTRNGLAVAVAAVLGTGLAHALSPELQPVIDGDATEDVLVYASEIDVEADTGTVLPDWVDNQDLSAALGFSINAGNNRFVRLDLAGGAVFANNPGMTLGGDVGTLSSGGMGESFAIFEITPSANRSPDAVVNFDIDGVTVFSEADIGARYRLFETATAAVNEGQALADADDTVYRFDEALLIFAEDANERVIEVATNSTEFVGGGTTTRIADIVAYVNEFTFDGFDTRFLWKDGAPASLSDILGADTEFVVSGDFSAVTTINGDPDPAQVTLDGTPADSLTAGEAVFVVGASYFDANTALGEGGLGGVVRMTVSGDDPIIDGAYTGFYDIVPADMSDAQPRELGTLSVLEKNGTTARANFLLTPGGAFKNFVRITNPSSIDGRVFVRLTNDAGESAAFDLGDITVNNGGNDEQLTAELPAGSATPLIEVGELFAAATGPGSDNPDFDVVGGPKADKMRLEVEGEFGEKGTPSAIRLDVLSVSNDNQSFFQFATDNFDSATQNEVMEEF